MNKSIIASLLLASNTFASNLTADRFLPATWKLRTTTPGVWEYVDLGDYSITQPGTYIVTAQLLTMIFHNVGNPASYFTIKAALFVGDQMVAGTETHCCISNYGLWNVDTVNPQWRVVLDTTGELEIRFSFYASAGLKYIPMFHWIGVAGAPNGHPENGRTWFRVDGPL